MVFMLLLLHKWLMLNFHAELRRSISFMVLSALRGKGNAVQANRKTHFDFSRAD